MLKRIFIYTLMPGVLFFQINKFAWAVSFGDFDPRSLAMGGAGVASATSSNAAYYNPALLAMFSTRKEIGKNSEFVVPTVTGRYVEALDTIDEVQQENPDQVLVNAINTFNANPNSQNAQAVLRASSDLESNLDELLEGPVYADVNLGMVLGIGHKYEGGSIIINRRLVGDAAIENFETDLQLLNTYVEAMQYIEGGGNPVTAASLYPQIFAADGTLLDQTSNLTSSAVGGALEITEIGMALARQFEIGEQSIAVGITPKVVHARTYDFVVDTTSGGSTEDVEDDQEDWYVNMDIGLAHQFDRQWRGGLVVKNLRTLRYHTSLGNTIEMKPQARLGIMRASNAGLYALDLDIIKNPPVRRGSESQMMSLGGEWRVLRSTLLRAGASKNLSGVAAGDKVLFTMGLHWDIFNGMVDLTYAENSYERAAGLQSGFRF